MDELANAAMRNSCTTGGAADNRLHRDSSMPTGMTPIKLPTQDSNVSVEDIKPKIEETKVEVPVAAKSVTSTSSPVK